jgi:hypothetical protein
MSAAARGRITLDEAHPAFISLIVRPAVTTCQPAK